MKLTKLLAMMLFVASPLSAAQTLTFNFDTVTESNVDAPSGSGPWATAKFTNLGLNQVEFLLTLNLVGDEFVSDFSFNLNPALDVTDLDFTDVATVGQFILPSITRVTNGVNEGQGTRFDFGFDFTTSNSSGGSRRFNETDSLSYIMTYTGSGTFNSSSFNYIDATNKRKAIAHIQSIGECDTSAWISPRNSNTIPEPRAALMLGAFGFITLLRRRK